MVLDTLNRGGAGLEGLRPIGMFDLAWVGVPITVAGILFMMLTARWLLPDSREPEKDYSYRRRFGAEFKVTPGSKLVGRTLVASGFTRRRHSRDPARASPARKRRAVVPLHYGRPAGAMAHRGLEPNLQSGRLAGDRFRNTLVEVALSRRCSFLGLHLGQTDPDSPYKANVVAASRDGQAVPPSLKEEVLRAGDIIVAEVDNRCFFDNRNETEFSMTRRITTERIQRRDKATAAILITLGMVVAAAMGWMSMLNAALLASGLIVLTGCISMGSAGRSIQFSTLVVIACAIGLESSVSATGLSTIIAGGLGTIGGDNAVIALTAVFVGCIIMDTLITNVASAAFMYPIAVVLAANLGVDFMPFAVTLMVGASCSFISPTGYQTNLMVNGPGKYSFMDFVRAGVPLTILVGVITIYLTPIVFPF
jgi:di/tricarboxylate transporter